MKKVLVFLCILALALGAAGAVCASATLYGISGLIETPNDTIVAPSGVSLTGNYISDFDDSSESVSTYGGAFGLMPKLEVSGAVIDSSAAGAEARGILNAKYKVLGESVEHPSITVGVVDISQQLKKFSSGIDEVSAFIVLGKNLSSLAEGFSGRVSKPVRGTIGLGTGLYQGIFAGLNFSLAPKFDAMVEYLGEGIRQDGTLSAGLRFNAVKGLSVEAGALDMKDFYAGASYVLSMY